MVGSDALALALRLAVAFDGEPPIELTWDAPATCPTAQALIDEVERFRIPRTSDPIPVRATVEARERGFATTVEIDLPSGTVSRSLQGEDCLTAVKATALVIAVAIDPTAVLTGVSQPDPHEPDPHEPDPPGPDSPQPDAQRPTAPASDSEDPLGRGDESPPPPQGRPRLAARLSLGGGGAAGLLPGFGPLARARAELSIAWFGLALSADYEPPRRAYVESLGERNRGADLWRWGVGLDACGAFQRSILRIPVCANLAGGLVSARGVRVENARTVAAPLWKAGANARVEVVPRGLLGFYVGTQVTVPFARTSFQVAGLGEVYRPAPVDLGVELGLVLQFGTEPRSRGQ